ncbi:hypothetical protein [Hyphomicrobium sp.]|uniref:hypothetical protein n=1 Tax=Hyphomicrobium sp. TaxID=82 RepID=UPI0025C547EF|nr:hypothetical protein [Hyphomicrobium sp.]MCC7250446.1 hypothetical protein [Hyphomicrobium sp.]
MGFVLTRRQFGSGLVGAAAASFINLPIGVARPWVAAIPVPPRLRPELPDYIVEEVRNLYVAACDERTHWSDFASGTRCGRAWSTSYILKIDGIWAIRDWTRRNAPWHYALTNWLEAIEPPDSAEPSGRMRDLSASKAWAILDTEPRTMADAALHRQVADYVFGRKIVFVPSTTSSIVRA